MARPAPPPSPEGGSGRPLRDERELGRSAGDLKCDDLGRGLRLRLREDDRHHRLPHSQRSSGTSQWAARDGRWSFRQGSVATGRSRAGAALGLARARYVELGDDGETGGKLVRARLLEIEGAWRRGDRRKIHACLHHSLCHHRRDRRRHCDVSRRRRDRRRDERERVVGGTGGRHKPEQRGQRA